MARYRINVPGAVTVVDMPSVSGSVPPVMVGDPPQWNDGSDATYAELETFEHPDVSYADHADGVLAQQPITGDPAQMTVEAHIRYQSLDVSMAPPRVNVSTVRGGLTWTAPDGTPGSSAPTWLTATLMGSIEAHEDVKTAMNSSDPAAALTLQVYAPFLRTIAYRQPRTRIFEVYLVIVTPSNEAPPCRMWPRDDDLGVGAGRIFPPPKSQQRSSRGVGYY